MKSLEKLKIDLLDRINLFNKNDENYEDKRWLIEESQRYIEEIESLILKLEKMPTRIYKEVKIETTFEETDYLLILHVYENEKKVRMQKLLSYETMTKVLYTENVDALYDHCEEVIKNYIQSNYNQIYTIEL